MKTRLPSSGDNEHGAVAIIVALSLIAIFGLIVLTVDVGQLLYKRRAMVNASDAAALAAAQSCAGITDSDSPEAMADTFAVDNEGTAKASVTNIVDIAGCDGPAFGHVTVEYAMDQNLFFAGVLGFNGPAAVRTAATAGWGPTGSANPIPIVVYTGTTQTQGECQIEENLPADQSCFLWYDNNKDVFGGSAFGFLNICQDGEPLCSKVGWDVSSGANCPNVGASERRPWIDGTWGGAPVDVNYPDPTYVCRLSGLASNLWSKNLEGRIGDDLTFPVNDCATQVDKNGTAVGCASDKVDKYNIIGFIVLRLDDVLDSKAEWAGNSGSCQTAPMNMVPASPNIDLDVIAPGLGCTPYDTISNVTMSRSGNPKCCTENVDFTYDPVNHVVDWIAPQPQTNVTLSWDYAEGGPCGVPPGNSSAVCLKVTTVEVRFGGSEVCEACPDFGVRAVRLCDLAIGSCPEDN
jgi:putative Flp pilus-assembly TadE/G-like protein